MGPAYVNIIVLQDLYLKRRVTLLCIIKIFPEQGYSSSEYFHRAFSFKEFWQASISKGNWVIVIEIFQKYMTIGWKQQHTQTNIYLMGACKIGVKKIIKILSRHTFPVTPVELHPHTDGAAILTVRYDSHSLCYDWRVDLTWFCCVSVAVSSE